MLNFQSSPPSNVVSHLSLNGINADDNNTSTSTKDNGPSSDNGDSALLARKKAYLALLPPARVIELCLQLEPHAPVHVRTTIWPADFDAAISSLTPFWASGSAAATVQNDQTKVSQENNVTGSEGTVHPPHAVDGEVGAVQTASPSLAAEISSAVTAAAAAASSSPARSDALPAATALTHHSATPTPRSSHTPNPPPPPTHLQNPYPYAPYGYSQAYPHSPYYPPPPPTHSHSSPHTHAAHPYPPHYGYPTYGPPPGYPPPPPPPASHPQHFTSPLRPGPSHTLHPHPHSHSNSPVPIPAPAPNPVSVPVPQPSSGDDLPSYEDMLVEALQEMGDPEGAAPKELFAWMAARYPVQANFRPSASQALQKAFKRGRLEKGAGGRYRLNPTWEGGATSKRTTRRPQTLAQTSQAHQNPSGPSSSPFTNTPLAHNHHYNHYHSHTHSAAIAHPSYQGYPYYPPYPPYYAPPHTGHDSHAHAHAHAMGRKVGGLGEKAKERDVSMPMAPLEGATDAGGGEGREAHDDAWEAAQHILRAFGLQDAATAAGAGAGMGGGSGEAVEGEVRTALTEEDRAEVQRYLERLAGQLNEIAACEDGEEVEESAFAPVPVSASATPVAGPTDAHAVTTPAPATTEGAAPQVHQSAVVVTSSIEKLEDPPEEIDEAVDTDEDEDMEMVEVDVPMPGPVSDDALRI